MDLTDIVLSERTQQSILGACFCLYKGLQQVKPINNRNQKSGYPGGGMPEGWKEQEGTFWSAENVPCFYLYSSYMLVFICKKQSCACKISELYYI